MKLFLKLYFIFFYLIATASASNISNINHLRKEFNLAILDEDKANILFSQLSKLKPETNTLQYAYWGATEALLAKHAFNPFSKLSYVNSAMLKLNKSVEMNHDDIEIRYMRFSVESNMPAYLGYSKHVAGDKDVLIKGLSRVSINKENCEMYKVFAQGLIDSSFCNNLEKNLLSTIISTCNQAKLN